MIRSRRTRSRRGAILIGVLACMVVATVLTALTLQSALRGRREARLERQLQQTQLLCEAGVIRAVKSLQANPEYRGETWQPPIDVGQLSAAQVLIEVTDAKTDSKTEAKTDSDAKDTQAASGQLDVHIVARLDSTFDNDGPMQRSHTFKLSISKQASVENSTESK